MSAKSIYLRLKSFILFLAIIGFSNSLFAQSIQFDLSSLDFNGFPRPVQGTSLKFGPDDRLYLTDLNGQIKIYTIVKSSQNTYTVVAAEVLYDVQNIPNYDDVGTLAWDGRSDRQTLGVAVVGTAENPVMYVTSSDPKWGGPTTAGGDRVMDTNSGIITQFTWTGSGWDVVDIVRGLPRSEENHSISGLEYTTIKGKPYLLVTCGGNTNAGSPGKNFAYTQEYAFSGSLLSIDLEALDAFPVLIDATSQRKYKYDLPTLDDPSRPNVSGIYNPNDPNYDGKDVNDPFGGNDGLNMAMIEVGGPVQIFSGGYRNTYDLVVTESGKVFVSDNGPNANWGGMPLNEANPLTVSNIYVPGEAGNNSTNPSPSGEYVTNQDHLMMVTNDIENYVFGSYYGGHPNPLRANPGVPYQQGAPFPFNPGGAGLYTRNLGDGGDWPGYIPLYTPNAVFRSQILEPIAPGQPGFNNYAANSLPANWPPLPVSLSNPNEADYRGPDLVNPNGPQPQIVTIWPRNSNAIDEYRASNFGGALKGALIAGRNQANLHLIILNPDGSLKSMETDKWNLNGGNALDITTRGDDDTFPGTIWVATFNNSIKILTPSNNTFCPSPDDLYFDPNADYDNDGYTNQDEIDNGTDYCSGASKPNDFDNDFISNLNDIDDDEDGTTDDLDPLQLGNPTNLPINNELFSDKADELGRPFGYLGLGLTGFMNNGDANPNWLNWLDKPDMGPLPNDIFGGAAGAIQIAMTGGTANGTSNTQEKALQFGINVSEETGPFSITGGLLGLDGPQMFYDIDHNGELGIQMGDGTQSNFLKLVFTKTHIVAALEINDIPDPNPLLYPISPEERPSDSENVDYIFKVNPQDGTVEPIVKIGVRQPISLGTLTLSGSVLDAVKNAQKPLIVGFYGSSANVGVEYLATFDYFKINGERPFVTNELPDISKQVSSPSKEVDLNEFFNDNFGLENLTFSIFENTTQSVGTSITGNLLTLTFPSSPTSGIITVRATDAFGYFVDQIFEVVVVPAEQILFRINAGGQLVSGLNGAPNWNSNNTNGAFSGVGYSVNQGSSNDANFYFENKDSSIPTYIDEITFSEIFGKEREATEPGNMVFSIPLSPGNYKVNLYMGNSSLATSNLGNRVFDIKLENNIVKSNFDLIQEFGQAVAGMEQFTVYVADGILEIDFIKKIGNPQVNAIEILGTKLSEPLVILTPIPDQNSVIGEILDGNLLFNASGGVGTLYYSAINLPPGIDIEPVNGRIYGEILPVAIAGSPYQITLKVTDSNSPVPNEEFYNLTWTIDAFYSWKLKNENQDYTARHENSFVQAGQNFYMMGGRENSNTVDVYDYQSDTWRALTGIAPLKFNHFQALEYKGYIWIIGAFQNNDFPNEANATHIWIFDPVNEQYIQGPEIPVLRRRGSAGMVLHNGKFYIVGGNTNGHDGGYVDYFDEFDPATGVWTILPNAPRPRDHFHAAKIGNKMYVASGRLSGGDGGVYGPVVKEVDVYDFDTQIWSTLPSSLDIPTGRAAAVVANFNGKLLITGGETPDNSNALSKTEIFDPETQSWSNGADLNFPRHGTQGIISGDGLFVTGGSPTRGGGNQLNMEYFGTNNPSGIPISKSTISGPNSLQIGIGNPIQTNLEISGGIQGVFVDTMYFSGPNAMNFNFVSGKINNSLLTQNSTHSIVIENLGLANNPLAILVVKYGVNSTLEIPILGTSANSLSNGLVGFWKMEEGGGNTFQDISGNGNHANISNTLGINWITGQVGLAVRLPSTTGRFGTVANNPTLTFTNAVSITAWIRPEDISTKRVMTKGTNGFELGIFNNEKIEFRLNRAANGTTYRLLSNKSYPSNGTEWIHVAATFDGTKSTIYINGVEDNSVIYSPFQFINSNADLQIGARGGIDRWLGGMDEVRLYNRALTSNEVTAIFTGQLLVPGVPNLTFPGNTFTNMPLSSSLTWEASAVANNYRVQLALSPEFNNSILDQTGIKDTFISTPELLPNTTYYWRVAANNQSGTSNWSEVWSFVTTQASIDPDLVGFWKMEEGTGNNLVDHSGNGNDATIINTSGITWVPGKEGQALKLNGSTGRYGSVAHSSSINISEAITISAWIRPTSFANKFILTKGGPDGYDLAIFEGGQVEFRINRESNGSSYRLRSNQMYPTDGVTWMHVVATFDGTRSTLYINGVEDNSATYSPVTIRTNTTALQIGSRNGVNRWVGDLDEIKLYKRALSNTEILSLYMGEMQIPDAPSLVSPSILANGVSNSVTLTWNASDFAQDYRVQVSTSPSFNTFVYNPVGITGTSFETENLQPNTEYYWRVLASNTMGDSDWSEVRSFTTAIISTNPNLVGHWKMEEGNGNVLLDVSGKGNHATILNPIGVSWITGQSGLGLKLDGANGSYGIVTHNSTINITQQITISAWIRPNGLGNRQILSKSGPDGYELSIFEGGQVEFRFNRESNGSSFRLRSLANYPTNGATWMHVAVTFNGTTSTMYINGTFNNSATYSSVQINSNTADLNIGSRKNGSNKWVGDLDEVMLFDKALTAGEISLIAGIGQNARLSGGLVEKESIIQTKNQKDDIEVNSKELGLPRIAKLFPNPVRDLINVEIPELIGKKVQISIYDMKGVQLLDQEIDNLDGIMKIDISNLGLRNGNYVLFVNTLGFPKIFKFIKE